MSALARPRGLLGLVAGYLVWSSAFLVLYGMHALGCAWDWEAVSAGPTSLLRLTLVVAWVAHVALAGGLTLFSWRIGRGVEGNEGAGLVARTTLILSASALVATLWTGIPVVAYPLCV